MGWVVAGAVDGAAKVVTSGFTMIMGAANKIVVAPSLAINP